MRPHKSRATVKQCSRCRRQVLAGECENRKLGVIELGRTNTATDSVPTIAISGAAVE
jgi:hypothetical protein